MTRLDALRELRDRVRDQTCDDSTFDWTDPKWPTGFPPGTVLAAYNGSVDAAIDFVKEVLPGWSLSLDYDFDDAGAEVYSITAEEDLFFRATHKEPARALLLAALDALIEQESE